MNRGKVTFYQNSQLAKTFFDHKSINQLFKSLEQRLKFDPLHHCDNFLKKAFLEAFRENCSRRWLHNFIKVLFCLSMKISKFLAA